QLVELVHLLEELEDALSFLAVQPRQGEADVNDDIVTRKGVGDVFETGLFEDAAEIDLAHEDVVFTESFDYLARDAEAHDTSRRWTRWTEKREWRIGNESEDGKGWGKIGEFSSLQWGRALIYNLACMKCCFWDSIDMLATGDPSQTRPIID